MTSKEKVDIIIKSSPIIIQKAKDIMNTSINFIDMILDAVIRQLSKIKAQAKKFIDQLEPLFQEKVEVLKAKMGANVEFVRPIIINKASIIASEGTEKAQEIFTNFSNTKDMVIKGVKKELAGFELVARRAGESAKETAQKIGESGKGIVSSVSNAVSTVINSSPSNTSINNGNNQSSQGGVSPFVSRVVDGNIG